MSSSDKSVQPGLPERPELTPHSAAAARPAGSVPAAQPANPAQPAHHAAIPVETLVDESTVVVRRAPRYFNFMLLGGIVGAVVALILTFAYPESPDFGRPQVFGFLLLAFAAFGIALGCIVALILDRVVGRASTTAVADKMGVHVEGAASAEAAPASDAPGSAASGSASPASDAPASGTQPGSTDPGAPTTKPE